MSWELALIWLYTMVMSLLWGWHLCRYQSMVLAMGRRRAARQSLLILALCIVWPVAILIGDRK